MCLKILNVQVHFIVAACENMISGSGMRPGDILTASNGKTIEVRISYSLFSIVHFEREKTSFQLYMLRERKLDGRYVVENCVWATQCPFYIR